MAKLKVHKGKAVRMKTNPNVHQRAPHHQGLHKRMVTHPEPLYEPNASLEGKDLKRFVRQNVQRQIRPTLREANRGLRELDNERRTQVQREALLGRQATQNVGNYYDQLAQQEAALLQAQKSSGAALLSSVGASNAAAVSGVAEAGKAAQEGLGSYSGADISSRDRLAQMIAEQGAATAQQGQALQGAAAGQANDWSALLAATSASGQMQGTQQLGDLNRTIQSRISELDNNAIQQANKVRGAKYELIKSRPELMAKTLAEARKEQSDLQLSKAALGIKKNEAKLKYKESKAGVNYAKIKGRQELRLLKEKQKIRLQEIQAQGASYQELNAQKAQQNKEYLELQKKVYGNKGNNSEGWQSFKRTMSYLRSSPVHPSELAESKQKRRQAYDKLVRYGASPETAKKVIKQYVHGYKQRRAKTLGPLEKIGKKAF